MAQEDKELLLKDICARLRYGIKVVDLDGWEFTVNGIDGDSLLVDEYSRFGNTYHTVGYGWKPYLRPMSSMTKDEKKEFSKLLVKRYCEEDWEGHISISYCIEIDEVYIDNEDGIKYPSPFSMDAIDWLNAHHFDYRGLIKKNLAIEVTEDNNPYKK